VHVVPGENGIWNVVNLQRRGQAFKSRASALDHARQIAAANAPSQVVLFDALGHVKPMASFQLPQYRLLQTQDQGGSSLFEAIMKALVIEGMAAAGIPVLRDLVDRVDQEVKRESAKARKARTTRRTRRR
jgi:hypothetical protein